MSISTESEAQQADEPRTSSTARGEHFGARRPPKRRMTFRNPLGNLEIFGFRVSRFPLPRAAQAAGCRHACGGGGARAGGKKSGVARVASKVAQVGWDRVPQACPQALLGPSRSENPRSGLGREAKRRRRVAGPASGVRRDELLRRAPRREITPTRLCTRVGLTGTPHRACTGPWPRGAGARAAAGRKPPGARTWAPLLDTLSDSWVCVCCIAVCAGSRASPSNRQRTGCVRERVRGRRSAPPIRWARRGRRRDGQRAMDDTRGAPWRAGR